MGTLKNPASFFASSTTRPNVACDSVIDVASSVQFHTTPPNSDDAWLVSSTVGTGTRNVDIGITVARGRTTASSIASIIRSDRISSGIRNPPAPGSSLPNEDWKVRTFSSFWSRSRRDLFAVGARSSLMAWRYSPIVPNRSSSRNLFSNMAPAEVRL